MCREQGARGSAFTSQSGKKIGKNILSIFFLRVFFCWLNCLAANAAPKCCGTPLRWKSGDPIATKFHKLTCLANPKIT